jgi:hypothetical protein
MMEKQWEFIAAMINKPQASSSSSSSSNTRLIKPPGDYLILLI